ncbi:MAG: CDP-alcohol phosphatidyltransferase family protein [Acidimicrobiia bacterium]
MSAPVAPVRRFGPGAVATPANALTIARLLLAIPSILLIYAWGAGWLTVSLWFVLSCTDGVDGWLARRDGTTRSGAFLDPLADKFLVLGGFTALALREELAWAALVIVAVREFGISAYRSFAAKEGVSLPARRLGKWKTVFQLLAVGAVLFPPTEDMVGLQQAILWFAVFLTVVSGLDIVRRGRRETRVDAR